MVNGAFQGDMTMIARLLIIGLLIGGASLAYAQNDPIAQRKETMKTLGGFWYGDVAKMMKGEAPFDAAKVKAALDQMVLSSKTMPTLFPDTAKTGGDTKALPTIWDKKDDFNQRWGRMGEEATAALASIKDEASLKAAQPGLNKNCSECHTIYRAKAN